MGELCSLIEILCSIELNLRRPSMPQSFLVEFEFGLVVIFLQPLVPKTKTSINSFTATSLSFPLEICMNK